MSKTPRGKRFIAHADFADDDNEGYRSSQPEVYTFFN